MITKNNTFSEIISQNNHLYSVVSSFGIDEKEYSKTIAEIGKAKNTDPEFIVEIVKSFDSDNDPDRKALKRFPIQVILNYLKGTHRYYLNKRLPEIELSLHEIIRKYHQDNQVLFTLGNLFIAYKQKLTAHIEGEEKQLFPYIEFVISQLKTEQIDILQTKEYLSSFTIDFFEATHSNIEEDIARTRETIMKFSPEKTYEMSYRIFLNQLELFEKDLNRHSIIEDFILVPKARTLEQLLRRHLLGWEA